MFYTLLYCNKVHGISYCVYGQSHVGFTKRMEGYETHFERRAI